MHHLGELQVAQGKLSAEVRALVPLYGYLLIRRDFANAIDHLHRMLQVVRKFAVMRHTELVSQLSAVKHVECNCPQQKDRHHPGSADLGYRHEAL